MAHDVPKGGDLQVRRIRLEERLTSVRDGSAIQGSEAQASLLPETGSTRWAEANCCLRATRIPVYFLGIPQRRVLEGRTTLKHVPVLPMGAVITSILPVPNENPVRPVAGVIPQGRPKLKQFADLLESGERNSRMYVCARGRSSETVLKKPSRGGA